MKSLILIPLSFPYSQYHEDTFLQQEIKYLKKSFLNFKILPSENIGTKMELDKSYIVDESFAEFNKNASNISSIFCAFLSRLFLFEILNKPSILFKITELKKILSFIKNTIEVKEFFKKYLSRITLHNDEIILYTYWTTHITFALGLLAKNNQKISVITRMHGYDLYEERGYVVCQKQILKRIKFVFFVSDCGMNYLQKKYNFFKDKYRMAPIGVEMQSTQNPWEPTDELRIVSCSSIDDNKRVEIIFDALQILAESGKKIIWTHFGSGKNENDLKNKIEKKCFPNLKCILMGHVSNDFLMDYYRHNPVDIFITTTASEGGRPVSIQEALSFGIPIVATSVGGIPEIVNSENGILLSPNPEPLEVSKAVEAFFSNEHLINNMRRVSYLIWSKDCDSDKNYKYFSNQLLNLC